MAVVTFSGDPAHGGIPRGSKVRIEALPERRRIWSGKASKSVSLDLDPGKYVFCVNYAPPGGYGAIKYVQEVFVDIDEEQFKKLSHASPTLLHPVITSEGTVWRCTIPQCKSEVTSKVAAIMHEAEHRGVSPFSNQAVKSPIEQKDEEILSLTDRIAKLEALITKGEAPKVEVAIPAKKGISVSEVAKG